MLHQHKLITAELQSDITMRALRGESEQALAAEFGVHVSQIKAWEERVRLASLEISRLENTHPLAENSQNPSPLPKTLKDKEIGELYPAVQARVEARRAKSSAETPADRARAAKAAEIMNNIDAEEDHIDNVFMMIQLVIQVSALVASLVMLAIAAPVIGFSFIGAVAGIVLVAGIIAFCYSVKSYEKENHAGGLALRDGKLRTAQETEAEHKHALGVESIEMVDLPTVGADKNIGLKASEAQEETDIDLERVFCRK